MKYSAMARNEAGDKIVIRDQEYPSKAAFIRDLRGNGYLVSYYKVQPSDVFDYIMEHTNCAPEDWKNAAAIYAAAKEEVAEPEAEAAPEPVKKKLEVIETGWKNGSGVSYETTFDWWEYCDPTNEQQELLELQDALNDLARESNAGSAADCVRFSLHVTRADGEELSEDEITHLDECAEELYAWTDEEDEDEE